MSYDIYFIKKKDLDLDNVYHLMETTQLKPDSEIFISKDLMKSLIEQLKSEGLKFEVSEGKDSSALDFSTYQVSMYNSQIAISLPYWDQNSTDEINMEVKQIVNVLLNNGLRGFDPQTEYFLTEPFNILPTFLESKNVITLPMANEVSCASIGIDGIHELLKKYSMPPSEEFEAKLIESNDIEHAFLYSLPYSYSVAKRYFNHWIPAEELIDASIIGLRKGINSFFKLPKPIDFGIPGYVVWWCATLTLDKLFEIIKEENKKFHNRFLPKQDLNKIVLKINKKEIGTQSLLDHYHFLFENIDEKYREWNVTISEDLKHEVIHRAINRDFSNDLLNGEDLNLSIEINFEDIVLWNYTLLYEKELKKLYEKRSQNSK